MNEDELNRGIVGFGLPIVDTFLIYEQNPTLAEKIKQNFKLHMSLNDNYDWSIYNTIFENNNLEILCGGSALNVVRATNFAYNLYKSVPELDESEQITPISYVPLKAIFLGSTSDDKYGKILQSKLSEEGVEFLNQLVPSSLTCTNIVLLQNKERTFFTNLGVAENLDITFFRANEKVFRNSKLIYTDAYLISRCNPLYDFTFKSFAKNDNIFLCLGLGSEQMVEQNNKLILEYLPFVDILFFNQEELTKFKEITGKINIPDEEFLQFMSCYEKENKSKERIIVNTRGKDSVRIFTSEGREIIQGTYPLNQEDIVDLNGAGDGFAGGFLGAFLSGIEVDLCAAYGNFLASEVIKLRGFQLPEMNNQKIMKEVQMMKLLSKGGFFF